MGRRGQPKDEGPWLSDEEKEEDYRVARESNLKQVSTGASILAGAACALHGNVPGVVIASVAAVVAASKPIHPNRNDK